MIIGVSGLAGSGKDTVADLLREDFDFVKVSFADPMKRFCAEIFDWSDETLWGSSERRNAKDSRYVRENGEQLTARFALQTLGTEFGRACCPSIWVDYALRTARKLVGSADVGYAPQAGIYHRQRASRIAGVVIPDCRFMNEILAVRGAGGKVIRVTRAGAGLTGAAGLHPSEQEMASIPDSAFDFVIVNDGSLEDLRAAVHRVASDLKLGRR